MTDSMIERVARAINPYAFRDDYQERYIFKAWQDEAKSKALRDARAAIEAMREPTEAMREPTEAMREPTEAMREPTEAMREPTEAMMEAHERHVRNGRYAYVKWQFAIDAALSEEPQ